MRAGGAAAPEHDGEDVGDLEQQARERPVRVLRKRAEQPTAAEVQEHEISGHESYRSWCRACVVGRRRADGGLAERAVKELKAKTRTLRHSTEMGLGLRIPETHDSLGWLVTPAAATINWFRPGLDGKTPYELRVGRKFRRPVAPWGQKIWWMSAKKHVSRISAESRWQEGIFLGILRGGVGASDFAIGTPDGVQPARAIKMVPEIDAWDIELLLAVKGLPWDRRPTLQRGFVSRLQRCPAGPERGECTSDVMWKFASTV